MTETWRPETADHLLDAVRWASAEKQPVEIQGAGSKRRLGRPVEATARLDLGALSGIVQYEPEELVLTARAGTSMAEIEAALTAKSQRLVFEPPDLGGMLDAVNSSAALPGTLGGIIACNLAGPRRVKDGAARDHLLGFRAVSGRGEAFKSGGRVVKNVTGFDLSKLIAGSFGTLAVMTEVTVRALPAPEEVRTILVCGASNEAAIEVMTRALQSPHEVSGAAHLPADVAVGSAVAAVSAGCGSATAIRIEGPAPSVAYRARALTDALAASGPVRELGPEESTTLWREIRDVSYYALEGERQIWRVSVPPAAGASVVAELFELDHHAYFDWGGGLIWLSLAPAPDAHHERVRAAVAGTGGHATLIRADFAVRAATPVFQPQSAPLAALSRRIKNGFDPERVLNRGRMYEGV